MKKLPLLAALLAGCAMAPRKPFTPAAAPADKAAVYFYRPSEMTGRLVSPAITANDAALGKLSNDSLGVAYLPAGMTNLRSKWPGIPGARRDDLVVVNLEAGKTYYLRVRYHTDNAQQVSPGLLKLGGLHFENRVGLEQVEEKEAVPQMAGMSPSFGL